MRTLPVLLLAAAAAEIASIIWVGRALGVIPTLLLMVLAGVAGVRLITSAGMSVASALRSPVQPASPLKTLGGEAAARTASGILFLLPGFFSDLLGLLLFVPLVRRLIASRFRIDTYSVGPAQERRFERVIEAEAVEIRDEIEPPDQVPR